MLKKLQDWNDGTTNIQRNTIAKFIDEEYSDY